MKTEYVCGFAFKQFRQGPQVVLIRKNKPDWQRGKLNGVGGKVEPGEIPSEAMVREFAEETGHRCPCWRKIACLEFSEAVVHFYCADILPLTEVTSPTDEKVEVWDVNELLNHAAGRPGGWA